MGDAATNQLKLDSLLQEICLCQKIIPDEVCLMNLQNAMHFVSAFCFGIPPKGGVKC